jgi:HemY protein
LWADLEDAEHGAGPAARDWLLRAAEAPADPAWTCSRCSGNVPLWQPTCPHCAAFDTLQWRPAPLAADALVLDAKVSTGAAALARPEALPPRERLPPPAPPADAGAASIPAIEIVPPAAADAAEAPLVLSMPPDVPVIRPDDQPRRSR